MTFTDIKTLGKFSISIPVGITAFIGYILYSGQITAASLIVLIGIFFLSAAASSINQIQEQRFDLLMDRTRNRPLPSKRVTTKDAWVLAIIFFAIGTLLMATTNLMGLIGGWMGLIWYNLIYTPLKRKSAFSVFPGAFVGAIPPIAGWLAAGGSILDYRLHFVALFFFIGQMPHFWLLVIKYAEDYKRGGFPTLFDYFSLTQISRINVTWLIATFVSAMLLPLNNVLNHPSTIIVLVLGSIGMMGWVLILFGKHRTMQGKFVWRQLFIGFNSFYLLIMLLISLDQIKW